MWLGPWPLGISIVALVLAGAVLLVMGVRFTRLVDRLADRTGLGEAIAGAVLLGATTSLPGIVTTGFGAAMGDASFAVSNALGGIAAQTMFLALADMAYRHANLEHAAASIPNLLQALLLVALLAVVLVGVALPDVAWLGIHPVTVLLVVFYVYGLMLTREARHDPQWKPKITKSTRRDVPEAAAMDASLRRLWLEFAGGALLVAVTGFVVGEAGLSIVAQTPLSGSVVGGVFTSVVTSLPELITVIVAVRLGALTLAVGDIIGGNTFDVLFVAVADVAYRDGPVYAAVDQGTVFLLALSSLMTAVLAAGLVHREEKGIGFEGVALLVLYAVGVVVLFTL